ncbi:MAG: dTDP-4-dehydrorhamnose 3,5-epimerase family protein, partial [Melioribacteraceae bacterium]|nr:dTDP-4-dehydrorhamnose 3,5-epimerase family protein [Melioribacteraceae bacterium]
MNIIKTPLEGLLIIEPDIFDDSRGYFFESFSKKKFEENGLTAEF